MSKSLKKLFIRAKKQVLGEMMGNNPSIFKGEGYDFLELREYAVGDDIRKIDWNISAKLQKPYVKLFREERELNVVVVNLLNSSTYFGSKRFKTEVMGEITATIGLSTIRNRDSFSSFIFADQEYFYQKPIKSSQGLYKTVDEVLKFDPVAKELDPAVVVDTLMKRVKKKSLIFIISDFYTPLDLRYLSKKSEVIAFIVRDKVEESPPQLGFTTLLDSSSGDSLEGDFSSDVVKEYAINRRLFDNSLYESFRKSGIRYKKLYTDQNIPKELIKFFRS